MCLSKPVLLAFSAYKLCKQFGFKKSGLPVSKLIDTLLVFQEEIFKNIDFEKNQQAKKISKFSQHAKS